MAHSRNKSGVLSLQFFSYPDEVGGAWKYTHEVNKRLARRGHRVFLITCKPADGLPDFEVIDGVHFYRIGARESKNALDLRRALRRITNTILENNPIDFIHVHNPLIEFLALLNPRLWRIPKIYHFHSLWFEEEGINRRANHKERPSLVERLKLKTLLNIIRLIEWVCFFSARSVLFLSEYSRKKFEDFFPFRKNRLQVIRGGVDVDVFCPPGEELALIRQKLNLPVSRPILLTVRRLAARMGLENLVLAMAMIRQRSPQIDFLLIIVGHGALEKKLKSLTVEHGLQDKVRLIGRLDTSVLASYYRSADLFILPTAFIEGFGMATAEALASGLPVLGTPVGGTIEILKSVNEKWLFRDTSPQAMADLIETFLRDPSPFLALKPLCRETAVLNYSWEHVVDRIEDEFHYIANNK